MKQTPSNSEIEYISHSLNKFQDELVKCSGALKSEIRLHTMRIALLQLLLILLDFNKKVGDGSWEPTKWCIGK